MNDIEDDAILEAHTLSSKAHTLLAGITGKVSEDLRRAAVHAKETRFWIEGHMHAATQKKAAAAADAAPPVPEPNTKDTPPDGL